jgi:cytochrome c553
MIDPARRTLVRSSRELQMRECLASLTLAACLGIRCLAAVAEDASKLKSYGRHLAQECTGCHRPDGVDNGIPAIVGWDAERFIATLEFYRTGERKNPIMVSVARSLDPEQMRALAAYYAAQPKR